MNANLIVTLCLILSTTFPQAGIQSQSNTPLSAFRNEGRSNQPLRPQNELRGFTNILSFGCYGDDLHDDTNCFVSARKYIESNVRTDGSPASDGNKLGSVSLYIPPGTYLITRPQALMSSGFTLRTNGYEVGGAGIGTTLIDYRPTSPGPLFSNRDAFINASIHDLSFTSNSAESDFMDSFSTGGAQGYNFTRVSWSGTWCNLFVLTGSNSNSEWDWDNVTFSGKVSNVLLIPPKDTSDQFLNYWFHSSKIGISSGNFITAYKGGHFKITQCDFSGLNGSGLANHPDYLFNLHGSVHARGVTYLVCRDSRFELKTNSIRVLYSEWGNFGEVTFEDDDFSSQNSAYQPVAEFDIRMAGAAGAAQYNFVRSQLIGFVNIDFANTDWGPRRNVSFEDVQFLSYDDYSQGVRFTNPLPAGSNYGAIPIIECSRCRGADSTIHGYPAWKPVTYYRAGSMIYSNGYVYTNELSGISGDVAPSGRMKSAKDGTVTWSTVDMYPGSDYAQDAEIRPWPYITNGYSNAVKSAIISSPTNFNYLPHRSSVSRPGFGRVILPEFATVYRVELFLAGGTGAQAAPATFVGRTDSYSPRVFFRKTFPSLKEGGSYDLILQRPFNVGTDLGSRSIILEAGNDVASSPQGWFIVWYL